MKRLLGSYLKSNASIWKGFRIPETNIRLETMTFDHTEEASWLVADLFVKTPTEPNTNLLTVEDLKDYVDIFCDEFLDQDLSIVAIDEDQNDKIVGVIISEDFDWYLKDLRPPGLKKMESIVKRNPLARYPIEILDVAEEFYKSHVERCGFEKIVHLNMGAVDQSVWGKNVLDTMIDQLLILYKEKGYEAAFGECTNYFSLDYFGEENVLMKISYDNFVSGIDGKKHFEGSNDIAIDYLKEIGVYNDEKHQDICKYLTLVEIVL